VDQSPLSLPDFASVEIWYLPECLLGFYCGWPFGVARRNLNSHWWAATWRDSADDGVRQELMHAIWQNNGLANRPLVPEDPQAFLKACVPLNRVPLDVRVLN